MIRQHEARNPTEGRERVRPAPEEPETAGDARGGGGESSSARPKMSIMEMAASMSADAWFTPGSGAPAAERREESSSTGGKGRGKGRGSRRTRE